MLVDISTAALQHLSHAIGRSLHVHRYSRDSSRENSPLDRARHIAGEAAVRQTPQPTAPGLRRPLPLLGSDAPYWRREPRVSCRIDWPVRNPRTRGVFAKKVVALPVLRWPDRTGRESAAAVRAHVSEDGLNAPCAKRTFITADARIKRIGWQWGVAVFASWAKFEHRTFLLPFRNACGRSARDHRCPRRNMTPDGWRLQRASATLAGWPRCPFSMNGYLAR